MFKSQCFFVLIFISSFVFGQDISVKGQITDKNTQLPLDAATIYISKVKDSTLVEYTISNAKGFFEFKIPPVKEAVYLKISSIGYEDYKKVFSDINTNINLENIALNSSSKVLGEVVLKSEAPPVRIKKDTLEFNANSFKMRPDANVEALLKQLPGVEIGTDGKITVNGKEVNQILVNGKPFFGKDGKIAIQSLPSELIKKVQITDTKTKKEELTGQASKTNNASINLTIDKDKEKGLFGKFMGGAGTNQRYESSALVNYFKNKRKISVLASSNNINSTGFSMDEIFDNMGGGRNNFYYADNGAFGIGNMRFGSNKGITKSNMVGVNYGDELAKDFTINGSYFFTNSNAVNANKTRLENLLPTSKFITNSNSTTKEDRLGHNVSTDLEYKIDSTFTINITPNFIRAESNYYNQNKEISSEENGTILNESNGITRSDNSSDTFRNYLTVYKSFRRKGRNISLTTENENSVEKNEDTNISLTKFYQSAEEDSRNQLLKSVNKRENYTFTTEYGEPITDSLKLNVGYSYNKELKQNDKKGLDFNPITQQYSNYNDPLSTLFSSNVDRNSFYGGVFLQKKKVDFDISLGTTIANFNANSWYLSNYKSLSKNYVFPYANFYLNFKFNKTKSFYLNYSFRNDFPEARQVLEVQDISNPLNTIIGNSNVGTNKTHYVYGQFRNFIGAKKAGYNWYFGGNIFEDQIVNFTEFDANRKRTTTYKNVHGTFNAWTGLSGNKTFKKDAHTLKITTGTNFNFGLSKGFNNAIPFEAMAIRITPRLNMNYDYGELFSFNPSYSVTFSKTNYTNYIIQSANVVTHRLGVQTTNYWPKNWTFGNDFTYTYNSNIADGFKKDLYLWNTSLAYSFFEKKCIVKVKVYDMLNQNQNATRVISGTSIRDEENTVLKRYAMFSFTYKIEKFAGKEKPSRNRIMFN